MILSRCPLVSRCTEKVPLLSSPSPPSPLFSPVYSICIVCQFFCVVYPAYRCHTFVAHTVCIESHTYFIQILNNKNGAWIQVMLVTLKWLCDSHVMIMSCLKHAKYFFHGISIRDGLNFRAQNWHYKLGRYPGRTSSLCLFLYIFFALHLYVNIVLLLLPFSTKRWK